MTIDQFIEKLKNQGLTAEFTAGKLSISGIGDSYLSSSVMSKLFKLGEVNKTMAEKLVNTDSEDLHYWKNLLDELGDVYAPGEVTLQVGLNNDENSRIVLKTAFSLSKYSDFRNIGKDGNNYLAQLDEVLNVLTARQTELGAIENRLVSVLDEIEIKRENLVSSLSTIRDADIAEETSIYITQQILQQAAATLLATANQTPSIALGLL